MRCGISILKQREKVAEQEDEMNIAEAVEALKEGRVITRLDSEGERIFYRIDPETDESEGGLTLGLIGAGDEVVTWEDVGFGLMSGEDLLADDWEIHEEGD